MLLKEVYRFYRFFNCSITGEVISEEYSLEYGTDKMEMHVGAVQAGERALVIDDLIATGGTLCAAIKLLGSVLLLTLFCSQIPKCFFIVSMLPI